MSENKTVSEFLNAAGAKPILGVTIPIFSNALSKLMLERNLGEPARAEKNNSKMFPVELLTEYFTANANKLRPK